MPDSIRQFKFYESSYPATSSPSRPSFSEILQQLETNDTEYSSEQELNDFLKSIGIRNVSQLNAIIGRSKPRRKAKRDTASMEDMSAVGAIVQAEVSKIVQGGNCNEHADTSAGILFDKLDQIEEDLGVQYVARAGLVGLDHEFLVLGPQPLEAIEKKTLFGVSKRTLPAGTVCIDSWPTLGQALLWQDCAWGKNKDATVNKR